MTNHVTTVPGQDIKKVAVIGAGLMGHGIAPRIRGGGYRREHQ